jgi:hypothetical protein
MSVARPREVEEVHFVHTLELLTGFGGLLAGMFLLDRQPILGVLGMLGAMALTLVSLQRLCKSGNSE